MTLLRTCLRSLARRPAVVLALWMLVALVVITICFFGSKNKFGSTAVFVGDANYYFAYLPSLVFDHDLNFTNEYVVTRNWYRFGMTASGLPSNVFGIGPAIFALPFFLAGLAIALFKGVAVTGFNPIEMKAALYASAVFTALSIWPAAQLLRRHWRWTWLACAVPAVVIAGTSAGYYAIRQPGYAHPFAMFWIAAFINHWDRGTGKQAAGARSARWWGTAGALLGAATLARPQTCTWGVLLLWPIWLDCRSGLSLPKLALPKLAMRWGVAAAALLIVFAPQLVAWKLMYGSWLAVPQGPEFMRWDAPAVGPVLFSSRNGLLSFTPLVTLSLLGFLVAGARRWRITSALLLGFALQVVVNGAVWDWWAGGSYGGRRFDSCFIVFCFGLAALLSWPLGLYERFAFTLKRTGGGAAATRITFGLGLVSSLLLGAWVLLLTAGNIALTSRISAPNLVSEGGEPLYKRLLELVPAPWAGAVAGLSYWSTKPARWWFSRSYGSPPAAYDWAIGKHFLGDTYPGLNSTLPARSQTVTLHITQPFLVGHRHDRMPVTPHDGHLRLLLPINRKHGPLVVKVQLDRQVTPGDMTAEWNGRSVSLALSGDVLQFTTSTIRRGVNVLDVQVPPETGFLSFSLGVDDNGLP